ncbi:hypothetical protein S7335_384 [Synechococcus sp. PCC 7335]|uniref:helix-turn-helix domain-containing protein n=1 Tax=Synechococcus sp. (strain ATCC 29403 / PCC 7335) TaxID=91464 RepID=UPI00017EC441|nr:helix-turn-helix transcriptional regulator [Synechococcus sp. PCC 7335]EDX83205.1 hypothetical protein S7335_384 [Synechococcus sp. PCC 7335]
MTENIEVYPSCGNVFEDLGLPDSDELLVKAKLADQISDIISKRKMTQAEAASLLGVDQPKVSALVRGKLSGFSIERLFRFLNLLGSSIEIRIISDAQSDNNAKTQVVSA